MSNITDQRNQSGGGGVSNDTRSERFRYGLQVYTQIIANAYGGGLNPALADLEQEFPFLVDAAMSFAIGEVWDRPQLAPKSRELAMIAALAALGNNGYPQLRLHVQYALNFGATPAELREIVYLTLVTAGVPKALNVAPEVRAVVGGLPGDQAAATAGPAVSRRARGEATLSSLNGEVATDLSADAVLGSLLDDFPLLVDVARSFALGDVWSRAILDPVDRELAAVAAFAAIGAEAWPQMPQLDPGCPDDKGTNLDRPRRSDDRKLPPTRWGDGDDHLAAGVGLTTSPAHAHRLIRTVGAREPRYQLSGTDKIDHLVTELR